MTYERHVGKQFARLTVLSAGADRLLCRCDCGVEKSIKAKHVIYGYTRSCGCLLREMMSTKTKTHGLTSTKEYEIWCSMKARCTRPTTTSYPNYGGRGIRVCDRWMRSFEHFMADMGQRPAGYSIDRIDVNGNYEPSNCRWVPRAEQMRNTRRTKMNKELADAVRELAATGINKAAIARALAVNYSTVKQIASGRQWK
jgi:hypothetical protein